jgi:cytochrome P450
MQNLQNEIRSRYQSQSQIQASSALQLPYLQAVIQEGLRIFPPGSQGFPRISPGVEIDGWWIPPKVSLRRVKDCEHELVTVKQTEIYTSAWTITHDGKYFHMPEAFIPERWLDPDTKDVKEASQPFSLGPRMCIGRK